MRRKEKFKTNEKKTSKNFIIVRKENEKEHKIKRRQTKKT